MILRLNIIIISLIVTWFTLIMLGCKETTIIYSPADNLIDPSIKPKVLYTYPPNNGGGPFNVYTPKSNTGRPHFFVQFNKLMVTSSFTSNSVRCRGSRPVLVRLYKGGKINQPPEFSNIQEFTIVDSGYTSVSFYHVGTVYTITFDTSIVDVNGNHLLSPYSFSFTPEPYLRVLYTFPDNGDTVSAFTYPQIMFNSIVGSEMVRSLHLSPPSSGRWGSEKPREPGYPTPLGFGPDTSLAMDTMYSLVVDQGAKDIYGNQLPESFTFSFHTLSFQVSFAYPKNGSTSVALYNGIYIGFTGPLDTTSVRSAFTINPDVVGNFDLQKRGYIIFTATDDLVPNTTYNVTISPQLRSIYGVNLSTPYNFSFTTSPFKIVSYSPNDGSTAIPRTTQIGFAFSGRIDTSSVRSAFAIDPHVNGIYILRNNDNTFSFVPRDPLSPLTTYQVNLGTSLRSIGGFMLTEPFTFSFTTGI